MKTIPINQDTTIDWYKDYHVNAWNLKSKLFDKRNDFCAEDNSIIHIDEEYFKTQSTEFVDEVGISEKLNEVEFFGNVIFALYAPNNYLVGYVEEVDTFGL